MNIITLNLTKSNLNKIIKWNNSRYNEYKKTQIVNFIIDSSNKGKNIKKTFYSGHTSYIKQKSGVSNKYLLEIENQKTTLSIIGTSFPNQDKLLKKYRLINKKIRKNDK